MAVMDKNASRLASNVQVLKQVEENILTNNHFTNLVAVNQVIKEDLWYVEGIVVPLDERVELVGPNNVIRTSTVTRVRALIPKHLMDDKLIKVGTVVAVTYTDNDFRDFIKRAAKGVIRHSSVGDYPRVVNSARHTSQLGIVLSVILDLPI